MGLMKQWKEFRQFQEERMSLEELILQANLGVETVTKDQALNIPAVSASVGLISDTVGSIPILLYKEVDGKITEVKGDNRVSLLNDETFDTLDGYQFKKALVEDYLLEGASYAYIKRNRNKVKSLHYVDKTNVVINMNTDPVFKSYDIMVNGATYRDFEFIKLTRKTKDGVTGKGIIKESNKMLSVAYNSLVFEEVLTKTNGNKRGFLTSETKLTKEAFTELKNSFSNLYKNNTENMMILNKGLDFKEASNTSVEMQLAENKRANSIEICKIFKVPPSVLEGKITDDEYNNFVKICILPILTAIETALNKNLLLPSEKGSFYFAFDTKELMKGDIEKRFKAYEIGATNGFYQIDEIRYLENLEPLGLDFIKLGLQDVLYNPITKEIYTPNTNKTANMDEPNKTLIGGEDENAD
jgi:HK97 family phage portal protein